MLSWTKPERYFIASACGRYTVSKTFTDKVPVYTAWRRKTGKEPMPTLLGCYSSPKEAQARCEEDLNG